ncbi:MULTISPECIES: tetratricopeptide repeat protein [unclassified Nodularia (in: cyanobacteria)]|uniref:tetratricopeptide repeat protein n=1 Tax=unclassified Nodularia (in: cyanobacteria) TaxID=2656917 RepID=UPI00188019BF|nr:MULTISPECIES: tetratricopeptide repeat protein [unclassified Nodularia (in: cyanobacteria)]MBE9198755.1 tetratricopeptide repeat protein [Nodularia sp. LEGE 06071]MCC2695347.1 tetratricopeptide repeat protein [Nodularia sp. LEGE 04288]
MTVITIREEGRIDTGFAVILKFDGGEYPVTITDPFTPKEEKLLEWYFEEWVTFPFSDTVIAERAAASVKIYGESLFKQLFQADFNAYSLYRQLRGNLSQVQIEIVAKTPEFHALHWEALQDPDLSRPLAVDCVMLRKNVRPAPPVSANVQSSPVINLLVVVARPDEERDVGYRTISRPLIKLIDNSKLRVNVELLRPGTYESLSRHLQEKGAGFYHVIHLDMHGALLNYQQVQSPSKPERYFYKGRYGRGDLQAFDGVKAFVCFEGESQGKVDLVEASELAALLTGKGIPVCILSVCQSGKQVKNSASEEGLSEDTRETSLGSRLMTAGMQMVVAMGYSVTVSAAKLMMSQLYQHLFDHKPMTEAIRLGRLELFNDKERKAYFNKYINLEDWLLPVVYSHQVVNFNLRQFTPEEEEKYYESVAIQYRFSLPEYGFIGRDLEILKIEKALLRHNVLLLQGMGGTGKTTLLNYLREWWQRTHFVEDVFYFGYDQKAWTLTQILFDIGQQVYGKFEQAKFQAMSQPAQVQKLVAKLRGAAYAVILDNLESVTGQQLAIQNTLPEAERLQIRDFIGKLVGGKTRVVLGSRSREEWLQSQTFKQNIYELQGLDQEARTELAEKILERNVAAHLVDGIRQDADFEKLIKLLAGYPLAMEVVLTNLQRQSPQEILQGLQSADVNLDVVSEDKTKSILKCVEYSHSNLSPDAQKLLLCLAYFSGFIIRAAIPIYIKELQKLEALNDYCFDKFNDAIQEAINWGLLSLIDNNQDFLKIQPIFPYFLKTKLASIDEKIQAALEEGFKNYYIGWAEYYKHLMDSKDAQERQVGIYCCRWEYENLYHALQICLQKQESIRIYFCLHKYFNLISDHQSKLKLAEMVCQNLENYPPAFIQGELGYQIALVIGSLGNFQQDVKQYQQAKCSYEKTLEIFPTLMGIEEKQKQLWQAGTYHQLGMVAQELREYEEARRNYQQVLNIYIEYGDRYSQAKTYNNLGMVAQNLREYEEARRNFQQALNIYIEYGDRYSQAIIYHNLGMVAQDLRKYEEARCNYQQALNIYIEYGDRYSQASTYHNLAVVAQDLREYEEARRNYQLALNIKIEYGGSEALPSEARYSQASTYNGLGYVAQELREYEEAQRNYQQALNIYIEYGDRYSQAKICHNLGYVAQKLHEYEETRRNYQQALNIFIEYGDRYEQAKTYATLGLLAAAEENYPEEKAYWQTALEIFVEYQDEYRAAIARQILDTLPD